MIQPLKSHFWRRIWSWRWRNATVRASPEFGFLSRYHGWVRSPWIQVKISRMSQIDRRTSSPKCRLSIMTDFEFIRWGNLQGQRVCQASFRWVYWVLHWIWSSMVSRSNVASDVMLRSSCIKFENWPSLGSCEHFAFLAIQLRLKSSILPSEIWDIHYLRARRFINSFTNLESSRLHEKGYGPKSLNWFTDLAAQSPRSSSPGFFVLAM
jgi:hypothetical protein